jgi:hypothetical protein
MVLILLWIVCGVERKEEMEINTILSPPSP